MATPSGGAMPPCLPRLWWLPHHLAPSQRSSESVRGVAAVVNCNSRARSWHLLRRSGQPRRTRPLQPLKTAPTGDLIIALGR
jgi:hypothetical protein